MRQNHDDAPIVDENDNTLDEDEEDNEAEKANNEDDGDEMMSRR